LIDSQGQLVAQQDGPIIDFYSAAPVQTSQMVAGKLYIDSRELLLPPGLTAGSYQLEVVVYQSWDNLRLMLPDARTAVGLDRLALPPLG
jgi:hypothetical protein